METLRCVMDRVRDNEIAGFTIGWLVRRKGDRLLEAHHQSTMGDDEHMMMLLGLQDRMKHAVQGALDLMRESVTLYPDEGA